MAATLAAADRDLAIGAGTHDELQDEVRGEFRFDVGRAAACAGAAWLQAGDGRRAESSVRRTIHADGASTGAIAAGARLDLASALLLQGELGGATVEVDTVLASGVGPRGIAVTSRVRRVREQLTVGRWRQDAAAVRSRDAAAAWLDELSRPDSAVTGRGADGPSAPSPG